MINDADDIKVSVCVVTYNQEKYIAECLDSLVSQETDFKFEIIVGEDCSTDSTRAIVQQYVDKYPDLIKPIFHKQNVGPVENIKQVYIAAQGKYIAHMDGDDMALPTKLQKQFDAMERNPQAMICSHDMSALKENGVRQPKYWNHPKGEYTFSDLVKKLPFFAHSSKIFRNINIKSLSEILNDKNTLDIEVHLYQASHGSIIHIEEDLGMYRVNVGVTSLKGKKINYNITKRVISIYESLLISNPEYNREIKKSYALYLLGMASSYAVHEADGEKLKKYTIQSFQKKFFSSKQILMLLLIINPKFGVFLLKTRHDIKNTNIGKEL